jgi:hypothetical protein
VASAWQRTCLGRTSNRLTEVYPMRASLRLRSSNAVALLVAGAGVVVSACGASNGGQFSGNGNDAGSLSGPNNGDGSIALLEAGSFDLDALAAEDPPNQWCGPDGEGPAPPPPVGGSPECPTDKNLPGCPCQTPGQTAACWPGLRANRGIGQCKDGQTTCAQTGEVGASWGPCVGAVLPTPGAVGGPAACGCFSQGQWHIENLVPFFITYSDGKTFSISTSQDPDAGTTVFPTVTSNMPEPPPVPTNDWSKDDLTVDCAGTFTLCYELKAGNFNSPSPSDCSIKKVCLPPTFYSTADAVQPFPPLAGWEADSTHGACALAFHNNGGYGEMSVLGESVLCQHIDDGSGQSFVFHRIQYCEAKCLDPANASDPACTGCGQDGSGTFK